MKKTYIFLSILLLTTISNVFSQDWKEEEIAKSPKQLKDTFKIFEIHTVTEEKIRKHIKDFNVWKGVKKLKCLKQ